MPYIPPPRPPPAPRPPVFRPPPGPSIHQQQMRRQQQHLQQQHQFRQQQQIRQFHQTQQQLVANQNRMQMDRNRQQQQMLRQQELHRQQQDHLRRQQQLQQDQHRRQQQVHQDHQQRQQQFHQNQQEQMRRQQQQLLQGLQSTSGAAGSSVFISPAFTIDISGLRVSQAPTEPNYSGGIAANFEDSPQVGQPLPSTPPPQQATPLQQAPPTNLQGADFYPPPYAPHPPPFSPTQSLPPQHIPSHSVQPLPAKLDVSLQPHHLNGGPPLPPQFNELPRSPPQPNAAKPPKVSQPSKNMIVLKDGASITIQSKDEYLFVGPQGNRMVVNCLPLYLPRTDVLQTNSATAGGASSSDSVAGVKEGKKDGQSSIHEPQKQARRGTKAMRRFVLKKAASSENLLTPTSVHATAASKGDQNKHSSEAEDIFDKKSRNNVQVHRDMWTHFNKSPGHQTSAANSAGIEEVDQAAVVTTQPESPSTTQESSGSVQKVNILSNEGESSEDGAERKGVDDVGVCEDVKTVGICEEVKTEGVGDGEMVDGQEREDVVRKEELLEQVLSGSDGEEQKEMRVSYIENPEQVETLKRSSGSVSFIGTASTFVRITATRSPPPASVSEDMGEEEKDCTSTKMVGTSPDAEVGVVLVDEEGDSVTLVSGENRECVDGADENVKPKINTTGLEAAKQNSDDLKEEMESERAELAKTVPASGQSSCEPSDSHLMPSEPVIDSLSESFPDLIPPSPTEEPQLPEQQQNLPPQPFVTPLPPIPVILEPEFIERSGWLMKLSHRRGVFGDKWQKRYFVLHGSWIYYFKKYGDSIPRGAIRLHPGSWVKSVSQGTARQSDAVAKTPPNAIISVVRCFGVHRPDNFASSLSNLLSQDGVADAFKRQTISVSNADSCSRTFYMIAPSNEERDAWVDAIHTNIRAYALSDSAMETSCKELRNMLRAVYSFPPSSDVPPLLALLHTRTRELSSRRGNKKI